MGLVLPTGRKSRAIKLFKWYRSLHVSDPNKKSRKKKIVPCSLRPKK